MTSVRRSGRFADLLKLLSYTAFIFDLIFNYIVYLIYIYIRIFNLNGTSDNFATTQDSIRQRKIKNIKRATDCRSFSL